MAEVPVDSGAVLFRAPIQMKDIIPTPGQASYYLGEHDLDYPIGFVPPGPYVIDGAEEWAIYEDRVRAIEDRWRQKERDEVVGDTV